MRICREHAKSIKKMDFLFLGAVLAVAAIYLWRLDLGFADIDETFYLSIPYRMVKGDSLIVDEWHVSQLWSFLIYPLMRGYLMIHSGTEGIVLAFRYIFLVYHLLIMSVSYFVLKKQYGILAIAAAVMYALFVPFGIMALNYNSIGLSLVFLLTILNLKKPGCIWKYLLNGVLMAGLVLCNPYTICLYLLYMIYLVVRRKWWEVFYTHVGILFLAIPFFWTVFARSSLREFLINFPNVLTNSAHPAKTLFMFLRPIGAFVLRDYVLYVAAFCAFWLVALRDKKRRILWFAVLGSITAVMVLWFALHETLGLGADAVMLPLTPLGFAAFSMMKKKDWRLFFAGLLFPAFYAMCMNLSSNQGMHVISNACTVSSCISVFIIYEWLKENEIQRRIMIAVLSVLVFCQIGAETYVKMNHVFWEDDISLLTCEITQGPLRGIKTTQEKKERHEMIIKDISELELSAEDNVLFYRILPYGYLMTDAQFGTFSAYNEETDVLTSKKLVKYYELHPEKVPDVIFVEKSAYSDWKDSDWEEYCQENDYRMTRSSYGNYILRK